MNDIEGKPEKVLLANMYDTLVRIHIIEDIYYNEYIKFSFSSHKHNIYFKKNEIPGYVMEIFKYINDKNKMFCSDDNLYYIIKGPCILTNKVCNLYKILIESYVKTYHTGTTFTYNLNTSLLLANAILKPIYQKIQNNN